MADTAVDFLLENLNYLMNCKEIYNHFSQIEKLQVETLYKELEHLKTFLKDSQMNRYEYEEVKDLVNHIRDLAYEAEDFIDLSIIRAIFEKKNIMAERFPLTRVALEIDDFLHHCPRTLNNVLEEIKAIKKEVKEIYKENLYGIGNQHVRISSSCGNFLSRAGASNIEDETIVGFDVEIETVRERLAGGSKQLDVISIVGMAGLGKTTLAKILYNDPFVVYHFHLCGWTYVSQVYRKRDLLLGLLSCFVEHKDAIHSMSDEKLGEALYRHLKGWRYLIVMDDIWNISTWDEMKIYFPNDNNGSRIMFTSRLTEVGLYAKPDSLPHFLRFLTHEESWYLLQQRVFREESCPIDLVEIGKQIAQKCHGLPLAIVVVAGLLAKIETTQDQWKRLAGSLSSQISSDPEQCMDTLALSYNHLPHHLKVCFLYFGAFPEDYEISARKLIWLWIAEGFIREIGGKTLEDVAEEYLMDLIDRSLVLVAKKKSIGGIKACRVHDLLRDLCLRKGEEENFLQQICGLENGQMSSSGSSTPFTISIGEKQRRMCILSHFLEDLPLETSAPHIRTLLCFASKHSPFLPKNVPCISETFRLLRVLDLSVIKLLYFPSQIVQLVLLRYLALTGKRLTIPESISNILNLETLVVSRVVHVPLDIWKMVKLRHICVVGAAIGGTVSYGFHRSQEAWICNGYPSILNNLQTILQLCPSKSCQITLARTPNLRKLGFCGMLVSREGYFWFPNLDSLNHLETLKLLNRSHYEPPLHGKSCSIQGLKFPPNIRRLTLSHTYLDWKEMSILGMLHNLEALKLDALACVGPRWETSDGGFRRLKYLRLRDVNIEQWEASSSHFPSLQRLVLHGCEKLEEIPIEFGNSSTLERIEVSWCSESAVNSARKIEEEQQSMGYDLLKIFVHPPTYFGMKTGLFDCWYSMTPRAHAV